MRANHGFTLIELAVVLIIIGLVTGAVLVGNSLISSASVRAQVSQIEKYQLAVNTFVNKYGYLPGDISNRAAVKFGFQARGTQAGTGDGNGVIEGTWQEAAPRDHFGPSQTGETSMFWVDLNASGLIDGGFNSVTPTAFAWGQPFTMSSSPSINAFYPVAAIGGNNNIVVWSGGYMEGVYTSPGVTAPGDGINYFSIVSIPVITCWGPSCYIDWAYSHTIQNGLSVSQAYAIDSKIDDGAPQSGNVTAITPVYNGAQWAGMDGSGLCVAPWTTPTAASSTTCFDNGGGSGPQYYSMGQNGGGGINCGLSLQFQ